jgi:hypothetical protein
MERSPSSLALVRKLASFKRGYVKINWSPDAIGTILPLVHECREIAAIAKYDAELQAQDGDIDGALKSCRVILIAGRTHDPASTLIQMLVRFAIEAVCLNEIERTLAQGEASEEALAALQNLLEDELAQPLLVQGLRGERGMSYRVIEFTYKNAGAGPGMFLVSNPTIAKNEILKQILGFVLAPLAGSAEANQIMCLQTLTELMEAMKLPEAEQAPVFARVEAMSNDWRQPVLFRLLIPAVTKVRDAHLRTRARLRCAVLAIAAERYRRKRGIWPDRLESLISRDMPQAGVDPYNDAPLILRRLPDGLVIYSVGPNRIDDGGMVGPSGATPDLGFRLWDVKARRQRPADSSAQQPEG